MIRNIFATWGNLNKRWRNTVLVLVPVLVAALVVIPSYIFTNSIVYLPWRWCGTDVQRVDDECIGVTDGRVPLSADLADVLGKIQKENERVAQNAVSVAYLMPLPKPSSQDELADLIHHELEGAYLAQIQANHAEGGLGDTPQIRLLVANSGDNSSHREQVVDDLLDKVD